MALIGAVMRTYSKIEKPSMCLRRTTLIPNHNIHRDSRHKVAYPYYIPTYLGLKGTSDNSRPTEHMGMLSAKCVTKCGKWGLWLYGESLSSHQMSSTMEFNKLQTRETFRIYTSSEQSTAQEG